MAIRWNKGSGGHTPRPPDVVELEYRRCKVCEWEGQLIVKGGEEPDCPWCHAPTEPAAVPEISPDEVRHKNPHAAALGRLGGLKGGRARAKALTPTQRTRIASRAARARWDKTDEAIQNQKKEDSATGEQKGEPKRDATRKKDGSGNSGK